jgi:hypothetical protein
MAGELACRKRFADLNRRLRAAARHQMLVGRRAAAITQVEVDKAVAHPAGHVNRVGARRGGVRQVERVVGVVAVQRVV